MRLKGSTILITAFVLVGLGLQWLKPEAAPVAPRPRVNWKDLSTGSQIKAQAVTPSGRPFLPVRRAYPTNPFVPSAQAAPTEKLPKTADAKKPKAKKKKKEAPLTPTTLAMPQARREAQPVAKSGSAMGVAGFAPAATSEESAEADRDLRDWREFVLVDPSHAKTLQLIESYRAGELSAEIFYTLVDEMLTQTAAQTRYFGVIALQATASAASFQLLEVHYPSETPGLTKNLMDATRNEYADIEKLAILSTVIASGDPQMALIAITRARTAVAKLPQNSTVTPVTSRNPRQSRPVRAGTGSLSSLETALSAVVAREPNTALGREASSLLDTLKRLNTQSQT